MVSSKSKEKKSKENKTVSSGNNSSAEEKKVDTDKLLIHTFLTEGYMPYAELFLESLRYLYGDYIQVKLTGLNLSEGSINFLKRIYGNLEIDNKKVDDQEIVNKLKTDPQTIETWRQEIERGVTTESNFWYKLYISVEQRYRSLDKVVEEAKTEGFKYILHSDVDIYFRKPFAGKLLKIMKDYDLGVYSIDKKQHTAKYFGGFICFNLKEIDSFINQWMKEIDSVPFEKRWKGFGQSALYFAIHNAPKAKIGDLSSIEESPKRSGRFEKDADFWQASNSARHKITRMVYTIMDKYLLALTRRNTLPISPFKAIVNRQVCWEDFKKGFPRLSDKSNIIINLFKKILN